METLNEALIACVKACGGSGVVGRMLWPEKSTESAQRLLLDCLNDDRPAKLCPEQVMLVLRLARKKGYHAGVDFILADLGYTPTTPIEPRDEAADLMRQYIAAVEEQKRTADRMEKAASRMGLRAVGVAA